MCVRASQKCKEDEEVGATVVGARRLYICYQRISTRKRTEKERVVLAQEKESGSGISREIVIGINRHNDEVISIFFLFSHSFFLS